MRKSLVSAIVFSMVFMFAGFAQDKEEEKMFEEDIIKRHYWK